MARVARSKQEPQPQPGFLFQLKNTFFTITYAIKPIIAVKTIRNAIRLRRERAEDENGKLGIMSPFHFSFSLINGIPPADSSDIVGFAEIHTSTNTYRCCGAIAG